MAKQFTIAPLNPLGLFKMDDPYELNLNNDLCYVQKYSEDCTIQLLSDYEPIAGVYEALTGYPVDVTPIIETKATNITGQTFSVYEITYPFGSLNGTYIVTLGYEDDNGDLQTYQSLQVSCKAQHPNTILFTYSNSRNDFGVAFSTGVQFKLRVEAVIRTPQFESNDTIYNDLNEDSVLLDSMPFRTFRLICGVGQNGLIPDWMGDKINRMLSCDTTFANTLQFTKVEGQALEQKRPDPLATKDKPNLSLSTTIQPVENISLQRLILGDEIPVGYTPMSKYKNYFNVGADFTATGLFNAFSLLTYVIVRNKGTSPLDFKVGRAAGADDIVHETSVPVATVAGEKYPIQIDEFPGGDIYFSTLSGANVDIYLHWLQFDEKEIVPGRETTIVKMPARVVVDVDGTREQLEALFDFGTGLGRVGTDYENARICDGRNGTRDYGLRSRMSFKEGAKWSDLGITVTGDPELAFGDTFGQAQHTLTHAELPELKAELPGATNATPNAGKIPFSGYSPTGQGIVRVPVTGPTGQTLQGLAHNNLQPTVYVLTVQFF